MVVIRAGRPEDVEAAIAVWREAHTTRRGGRAPGPEREARVVGYAAKPDSFFVVAEEDGELVGMALGQQGLAQDGAGPAIPGLCHISMVFVVPDRWGDKIGTQLVEGLLGEAKSRGYAKAQLWTQVDNAPARYLYEGTGFHRTGRTADDGVDETITHYERVL